MKTFLGIEYRHPLAATLVVALGLLGCSGSNGTSHSGSAGATGAAGTQAGGETPLCRPVRQETPLVQPECPAARVLDPWQAR